jgi:LAS superfamily LD-carboxypeptidase LdcB
MSVLLWVFGFFLPGCQNPAVENRGAALSSPAAQADTSRENVGRDYLLGKFDPATHPDFVKVGKPYSDRPGMLLRKETFEAFKKMWTAAKAENINLRIISSTRNFNQQKNIWETKWERFAQDAPLPKDRALKILEFSSMPGSSRHHWGTDVDLNDLNNPSFEAGGKYRNVYEWLRMHAHEYGFCQPYTAGREHGYHEEKWHWSYTPLSKPFLEEYKKIIKDADIQGFKGAELAPELHTVMYYVGGINLDCQ